MSKVKSVSPPLSTEEIDDIKKARTEKGKIYDNVEDLIRDLHKKK
jgi:hypothetical protein